MKKRLWIMGGSLVACGCLWAALSSQAADKDKPAAADKEPAAADDADQTEGKSSEQADAVQDIATAYKLADWGRRMDPQSPFALCTAAEMLHRTTLFDGTDPKANKDGHVTPPEGVEKSDPKTALAADVDKLLDEAVKMAKTNKQDLATVQAMAKAVREGRGGLNGPLMFTMRLRPGQTDTYDIKFKRGEWARIAVHQPSDNVVDLHAEDKAGHGRATDRARNPVISFLVRPGDGADYKVTVRNARGEAITYQLFTN
jgi:hypothetical protein